MCKLLQLHIFTCIHQFICSSSQKQAMAPNHLEFSELRPSTKYYRTTGMVIEKALPRLLGKTSTLFQRLVLQNSKGEKIQAGIYMGNINVLQKTLKLYHCYAITNAPITTISEAYRFLEIPYQITLNAKTPIEDIQIDGLTMRSLKYNFTQLSDIDSITDNGPNLDVLFAILEVGAKRKPRNSWVANVKIVDQSLQPTTISLWDQFSENEATAMANLPGTFPIAIGLHLRIASYYGTGLGTHNSTTFIFNPPIPQATALQAWCNANADKIKALPPIQLAKAIIKSTPPKPEELVKIVNLPTSVEKPEYHSVEGVIRVADLKQKFYYLVCSICNESTAAFGEKEIWCNHCSERVTALPKIKFVVQIADLTGYIQAMVFTDVANQYYSIEPADIDTTTTDGSLPLPLLEKLSQPRDCTIYLKAYMNDYGGINECKFIVQSIFNSATTEEPTSSKHVLMLAPETPNKRSKSEISIAEGTTIDSTNKSPESSSEMDADNDIPLKRKKD